MRKQAASAVLRSSPWVFAGLIALIGGGFLPENSSLVPCCGASIPYRFLVGGAGLLLMLPVLREGIMFAVKLKNGESDDVGKSKSDSASQT